MVPENRQRVTAAARIFDALPISALPNSVLPNMENTGDLFA
jgi:hypothetical protein